jgi:beta-glucosidase-like glycosyl hydrolase
MVGHLIVEKLDNENPASLSKNIVSDLLRKKLNYDGVIVTDGLDMKSITDKYNSKEIAELAVNAGVDVLLIPEKPKEIIEAIQQIIEQNENLKESLLQSVNRIHNLKVWTKLIPRFASSDGGIKIFSEHLQLALKAAIEATELIFDDRQMPDDETSRSKIAKGDFVSNKHALCVPIPENKNYAAFSIIQKAEDIQSASRFFTMLAGATENDCDYAYLDEAISDAELNDMKDGIIDAEFIIFALFYRGRGYADSLGSAEKINNIIEYLSDGRDYIVIFFGDPYIAETVKGKIKILTYSDSFASLASAIMKLTGRKLN